MADEVTRLLDKILGSLAGISGRQLAIDDCHKLESKANSAVSAIRLLRNLSTPIHKLPIEVLAVIFTHVTGSEAPQDFLPDIIGPVYLRSTSSSGVERLVRVCRKWRDAAFAFPALWSTVYFVAPNEGWQTTAPSASLTRRLLQVQKSTPLKVFALSCAQGQYEDSILLPNGVPDESESTRFFRLIAPRASRTEELHIINFDHDALKKPLVSHRPSLNIITALTLPKETPDATFLAPNLSTLRIYDNQIPSVLCLSIFAEQRDRRNNRLRLLEIISASTSPPSSGWGTPTVNAHPSPNTHVDNYNQQDQQAFDNGGSDHIGGGQGGTGNRELEVHPRWPSVLVADLITMGDYVETVDCTKVEMGAAFDIVSQRPPRAFTWLAQMMF
ncbi:hypothetical protein CCMSSC00406_0000244 [Pleurotus cornucopiae]|uniref:Uncharacterized protein n=1 Tax=Pleurotus cornucopiae TaxID=5321 RepID=A0ACB7IXV7_PLECO|nr:hypothetical protein CCMSSC00406_0000244 [Pleurotus cornucopiae]